MKFCLGVIVYLPQKEHIENIIRMSEIGIDIYIYCNSDINYTFIKDNIKVYGLGENKGLSFAYNYICNIAFESGFDYILLLDQDSKFSNLSIKQMCDIISANPEWKDNVGICAPNVIYNNKNASCQQARFDYVDFAISSGSFVNLSIFNKIKGFDMNFFIDRVDTDYCKQLLINDYKIVRINNVLLYQKLGDRQIEFIKTIYIHSQIRNYYIFRNRLYYYKKYNDYIKYSSFKLLIGSIIQILEIIFFNDDKLKKLKILIRAYMDYKQNKMEKFTYE